MIFRTSHSRPQTEGYQLPDREDLAAQAFARRCLGSGTNPWTDTDESELKLKLEQDLEFADAFRRVEQSWEAAGDHSLSPEFMALREQAIARARRSNARRWNPDSRMTRPLFRIAAGVAVLGFVLTAAYSFAPFGWRPGEYRTNIGEQRVVELTDHSRIALDAATRIKVRYTDEGRTIELLEGQAQFSVAKDPARPFKVDAGDHTVIALGTVFTVEYIDKQIHVAMLEGKVAVTSSNTPLPATGEGGTAERGVRENKDTQVSRSSPKGSDTNRGNERMRTTSDRANNQVVELTAGEELRVNLDGQKILTAKADLNAATAWRQGKVIFHSEPLSEAVRRLNRYSKLQLEIDDPALNSMNVSGVFDAGDAAAFAEAVESYLPATADYSDPRRIRFRAK